MNIVLKFIKSLLTKEFATVEEKAELTKMIKKLETDEQETLQDDVDSVNDLPEEEDEDEDVSEEDVEKKLSKMVKSQYQKIEAEYKVKTDKVAQNIEKEYQEKLESWKVEQKELMEKKVGLYNPDIKEVRKNMNDRVKKFVIAMRDNDYAIVKDLSEGTDNKGGYLVDSELNAEIQHLMLTYGVARSEMTTVQLSKGDLKLNNLAADLSVYWTDEAAVKTSSDVTIGQVTLSLKKIAVLVPITDELLEDSEIDIVSFISTRVAEKFAQKEDLAFFLGDGTSAYGGFTGVLNNVNINTVTMTGTTFASVDADDLLDMIDATPSGALKNAKFYLHRTIMSYIRKAKTTTGDPIFQKPSEKGPGNIWGYPIVICEAFPATGDTAADTPFILFGDLKKSCWLGYKGGIRTTWLKEATITSTDGESAIYLGKQDMTALRFVERVGYVKVVAKAVTGLFTAASSV